MPSPNLEGDALPRDDPPSAPSFAMEAFVTGDEHSVRWSRVGPDPALNVDVVGGDIPPVGAPADEAGLAGAGGLDDCKDFARRDDVHAVGEHPRDLPVRLGDDLEALLYGRARRVRGIRRPYSCLRCLWITIGA